MIEYEKVKEAQEQNYHHGFRRYSELVDRKRKSICSKRRNSSINQRWDLKDSKCSINVDNNNVSKIINMQNMNYYVDNDGNSSNDNLHQENNQKDEEEVVDEEEEEDYQSDNNEIQIWICGEPRFISGISSSTTCNDIIQALIDDEVFSHDGGDNNYDDDGSGDCCGGATNIIRVVNSNNFHCSSKTSTPRQKTISNKGKVMATTAKNVTVISATAAPVSPIPAPPLPPPTPPPSRDLNDYVITERWRDVEQALSGETLFLPIWTAWGNARSEVKFKLKINKEKTEYDKTKSSLEKTLKKHPHKSKRKMLSNILHRLIEQSEAVHNHFLATNKKKSTNKSTWTSINGLSTPQIPSAGTAAATTVKAIYQPTTHELITQFSNSLKISNDRSRKPIDKELFMSIDIETGSTKSYSYSDDQDSHLEIEYRQYFLNKLLNEKINAATRTVLQQSTPMQQKKTNLILETPKHKSNSIVDNAVDDDYDSGTEHSIIVADTADKTSGFGNVDGNEIDINTEKINLEIASHISELKRLWQYEEDVMGNLSTIYSLYRAQNQIYREINYYQHNIEAICIDEVQQKLEIYTNQIVEMEFELFQVKLEISQHYDGLENCGRLLKSKLNSTIIKTTKYSSLMRKKNNIKQKMEMLTNNNYESSIEYFDDNNKTMFL